MTSIPIILLLVALICFLLDAFGASPARVKLTPLGLAALTASMMVSAL